MKFMNPSLNVPYIGMDEQGEPTRNYMTFRFDGLVDHRRLKRMVRKVLGKSLERTIHTSELHDVVNSKRITCTFLDIKGKNEQSRIRRLFGNKVLDPVQ